MQAATDIVPMDAGGGCRSIINSCSVTADADSSCRQLVRKVLRGRPDSRVVVTGCYAERSPDELRELSPRVEVFGNHEKPMIAVALGVPTACVQAAASKESRLWPIAQGPTSRSKTVVTPKCTYCIIPSVRPNLICRPPELILKGSSKPFDARGFKEIVLDGCAPWAATKPRGVVL